MLTYRY